MNARITAQQHGALRSVQFFWPMVTPHGLRFGDGRATLEVRSHTSAGWVSFDTFEHGPVSTKRTMITLDPADVKNLHTLLGEIIAGATS